ncbi:MAG: prepilin peptidase [Sulfitobacter sp.]
MIDANAMGVPVTAAFCVLMTVVIYWDIRHMRIPHWLLAIITALFLFAVYPSLETGEVLLRVLAAGVVFALCMAAFATRRLGGGDAKLLPLMMLFVSPADWALFALCLSVGLIAGLTTVRILRHGTLKGRTNWTGIAAQDRYPLGPGIGLACILFALCGPMIAQLFQS